MKKNIILVLIICMAFSLSYIGKRALRTVAGPSCAPHNESGLQKSRLDRCRRIISMAPSITETLFALGLGERVVAVTRYCQYPAEAKKRIKIGGYYDANYEAIMGLSPDLVILLPEQDKIRQFLEKSGFSTLTVDNKTIPDILGAINAIGQRCDVEKESKALTSDLQKRMDNVRQRSAGLAHPKVLVSIGGGMRSGSLDNICAAGRKSFYGQMVELVGGSNVYQGPLTFPDISKEGVAELNPQIIIDIFVNPDYKELTGRERAALVKEWKTMAGNTDAAKNDRIELFVKDYTVIPGPRFILALEDMAKMLHSVEKEGKY